MIETTGSTTTTTMATPQDPASDTPVQEAMTPEELAHAAEPDISSLPPDPGPSKRPNACMLQTASTHFQSLTDDAVTELMSAAKKPKPTPTPTLEKVKRFANSLDPRNGLGIYINHPEKNPEGRVVEYDDEFVVIRDKFPKARYIHLTQHTSLIQSC